MSKSRIEYVDTSWSPITGCRHTLAQCPVADQCWARSMAKRFHGGDFEPRFHRKRITEPLKWRKPRRVAVCFMGDLFGEWVIRYAIETIQEMVRACPQHTFLFLTKNPKRLAEFNPWPDNAWVGASVVADGPMTSALTALAQVKAPVRWLSIEPLMGRIDMSVHRIKGIVDWVVIGGYSGRSSYQPRKEWVEEITESADQAGIAVWQKENLFEILGVELCQELPHA